MLWNIRKWTDFKSLSEWLCPWKNINWVKTLFCKRSIYLIKCVYKDLATLFDESNIFFLTLFLFVCLFCLNHQSHFNAGANKSTVIAASLSFIIWQNILCLTGEKMDFGKGGKGSWSLSHFHSLYVWSKDEVLGSALSKYCVKMQESLIWDWPVSLYKFV